MKILKFGGSSVATPESILRVKQIVSSRPESSIVVVSALGGVTDQLIIKSGNPIDVVAKRMAPYAHNIMYMPVIGIQGKSGRELFNNYMLRGFVPPAYELCWGSNEDGAFAEACLRVRAQGSKIWVNTIWGSLCGGNGNDDDAAFVAADPGDVYQQYIDAGVSMIQTDRPELLIGWLTSIGRHTLKK